MILAAGRGERLRPLTDRTPKPLIEVAGKPLIVHHLQALCRAGISRVVINVSWLGQQIRERLGDGSEFKLEIRYSEEKEALETAGGIVQALPMLGERFLVINADIFTDYDFGLLRSANSQAHLVLVPNPEHNPQGDFSLEDSNVGNDGPSRYTFSGIAQYHRTFFSRQVPGKRALAPLLRAGAERGIVSGELLAGHWSDVGTQERLDSLAD